MDEKKPFERGLLIDRLQVSNVHMGFKPPNPERDDALEAQIAELRAELGIEAPLLYAPDYNLEVLLRAKELLQTDWNDADRVVLQKEKFLESTTDPRERTVTTAAVTLIMERLCRVGAELRRGGCFAEAELVYRILNQYCSENQGVCIARIRLAEMMRRKEIPAENLASDLSRLLRFPIQEGYGEALMNLALFMAERTKEEVPQATWLEDLQSCVGALTSDGAQDVALYWEALAMLGDPEGYLVHLLLLLFEKIKESSLGSRDELLSLLEESFPEIRQRFFAFTVENEAGQPVECEILFTFESDETGKTYLVYTDNTLDEEGSTKVYASIFDGQSLLPVETEQEWQMIEAQLEDLRTQFGEE